MGRKAVSGVCVLAVVAFAGLLCSNAWGKPFQLPEYTADQWADTDFVKAEISRLEGLAKDLEKGAAAASGVLLSTLRGDCRRVQMTLEALRLVSSHGYDPSDPEWKKLGYAKQIQSRDGSRRLPVQLPEEEVKVYELSQDGLTPPVPTQQPRISIPAELAQTAVGRAVKVQFVVDEKGVPLQVQVMGSPSATLSEVVKQSVLGTWRFRPATMGNKPVRARVRIVIPVGSDAGGTSPATARQPGGGS